jgi:IclR family KDG regulon transcriptional repressor
MKIVNKVCDVLDVFLEKEGQVNISDIVRLSRLNKNTVYRICHTLAEREYLYHRDNRGNYNLGLKFSIFLNLSEIFSKLKDVTSPFLQKLSRDTSETVVLSTLRKTEMINVSVFKSKHRLQIETNEGDFMPLHCTAMGKVLLASMIEEELNRIFKLVELSLYTENTITNVNQLRSELAKIKKQDIAFDNEEWEMGVRSVATPIKNNIGRVIAVMGIIGPTDRLSLKRIRDLASAVKLCGREINEAMSKLQS